LAPVLPCNTSRPERERSGLFHFICDHVVPGCTHEDSDPDRDRLLERVGVHLREHHDLDHRDEPIARTLKTTGIVFIRPA